MPDENIDTVTGAASVTGTAPGAPVGETDTPVGGALPPETVGSSVTGSYINSVSGAPGLEYTPEAPDAAPSTISGSFVFDPNKTTIASGPLRPAVSAQGVAEAGPFAPVTPFTSTMSGLMLKVENFLHGAPAHIRHDEEQLLDYLKATFAEHG